MKKDGLGKTASARAIGGGWRRDALLALCVAALAAWAYWGSLELPWLFDDHQVLEKATLRGARALEAGGGDLWRWVWLSPRPLRQLTFWADARVWGDGEKLCPAVRAENLGMHAAVAVIWGLLLRRLGRRRAVAWGAAALFAALPVHWETLGIASHRKELLAAFFGLLGVAGTLGNGRWKRGLGLACFALAAMGKETAVSYTALAAMLGWWSGLPGEGGGGRKSRLWPLAALGMGLALGVVAWAQTKWSMDRFLLSWDGDMGLGAGAATWGAGLVTAVRSFPRYLAMMAGWKVPCLDRGLAAAEGWRGAADAAVSGLFVAAWGWGAWRGWRSGRGWGAAMAWVALALGVVLAPPLLEGRQVAVLAGRYAYGAALGFAWLAAEIAGRVRWRWGAAAVLAVLALGAGAAARGHAGEFESERALWTAVLKWNPGSRMACHNLVQAMRQERDHWGAVRFLSGHIRKLGRNPFAQPRGEGPTPVAVVGDSVPYGWDDAAPEQSLPLSARLGRRAAAAGEGDAWTFANWAVPGSTLASLPGVVKKRLRENPADWCMAMSGHNDAAAGASVEAMLRAAADVAVECFMGGAEPLLVGPAPVKSSAARDRSAQAATLRKYARRLETLCAENGVRYLDFPGFAAGRPGLEAEWSSGGNGVHLSFAGMENLAGFVFFEGLKGGRRPGTPADAPLEGTSPGEPFRVHRPGRVRFALCQLSSKVGDVPGNALRALAAAEAAADREADVVVFPELSFVSFHDLMRGNTPVLGVAPWGLPALSSFARRRGCWVVANHPRAGEEGFHNESMLVAPDGAVAQTYRKRVLAMVDEYAGMTPGDEGVVAELPFARIGLLVCKDASCPELFAEAYGTADLLVEQFAHVRGDDTPGEDRGPFARIPDTLDFIVEECARVLGKTQLLVDKTGEESPWVLDGGTRVVAQDGRIVADAGEKEGILFADFPLDGNGWIDSASPIAEFWAMPAGEED